MPTPDLKIRLEYVGPNEANASGRSSKFWQAEVYRSNGGAVFVRRWGKILAWGDEDRQPKRERYPTIAAAQCAALKMVEKKRKKGYTLEVDVVTLIGMLAEE
jgi:predicted DNA-binding WGR domain protein